MSEERARWEARYGARTEASARKPSLFLSERSKDLPNGRALDLACGEGRNTLLLAEQGFAVDGLDLSCTGLTRAQDTLRRAGRVARFVQCDLETFPLPVNLYDVVLNVRYLQRSLWPSLKRAVRESGMIVFETFLREQAEIGHPSNPAFLLGRRELAQAFADFEILSYEEGLLATEDEPAYLARMLARRPVGWTAD